MNLRTMVLAAETYSYSYFNYYDHLGIGHIRFEKLMPQDVATLAKDMREKWTLARLAKVLDRDESIAQHMREQYQRALEIADAENPAEAFRSGVRHSIQHALKEGLSTDEDVEMLVTQICYRTADLAFLLDISGEKLSRYSRHLRHEKTVEVPTGYFDKTDSPDRGILDEEVKHRPRSSGTRG